MTPAQKCRLAIAMTALASYAACGDATVEEAAPAVAHEVPKANYAYPRPEPADVTAGLDRKLSPPRAARSRPRPAVDSSRAASRPGTGHTGSPSGDVWARLAACESGMRQDAVGDGVHFSYFQWKLATWRSVKAADDPADPREASYGAQVAAAQRLQARSGWGQWPACSRKLGLR